MDLNDLRIPANRHGYVYLISATRPTDSLVRYYVGQHLAKTVDRNYLGSGTILNRHYRKHGKMGNKKLLLWAYSKEELDFYEIFLIQIVKLTFGKDCINLNYGGARGKSHEATRRKQSKARVNKSDAEKRLHQERIAASVRNRSHAENARIRAKLVAAHANRSPEAEALRGSRVSEAMRGRKPAQITLQAWRNYWDNKSEDEKIQAIERLALINRGKKLSPERRQALRDGQAHVKRIRCQHCGRDFRPNMFSLWHGDKCKLA